MRIVYTCPNCGADIEDLIVATNPPITLKRCTQCDWAWCGDIDADEMRIPFMPPVPYNWNSSSEDVPECCLNCNNHPINGGAGICMCALPYITGKGPIC